MTTEEETKAQALDIEIYKKWHRTGFVSISFLNKYDKAVIEIGETDPSNNNALKSATKCYVPVFQFLAYLRAEVHGRTDAIFPAFAEKGVTFFGGGKVKNGPYPIISRIFSSSMRKDRSGVPDPSSRTFLCAHYEGALGENGIVTPDYKNKISMNTIKLTLAELSEIFETLLLQVYSDNTATSLLESGSLSAATMP